MRVESDAPSVGSLIACPLTSFPSGKTLMKVSRWSIPDKPMTGEFLDLVDVFAAVRFRARGVEHHRPYGPVVANGALGHALPTAGLTLKP